MGHRIAFISQSGNVMKTSLAFGLSISCLQNGLSVEACDLDIEHRTLAQFGHNRQGNGLEPPLMVYTAKTAKEAIEHRSDKDLFIIDCPSRASKATLEIARHVDLVIQPSTTGRKDLDLAIKTFYQLAKAGIPQKKLIFALTRVSTQTRIRDAQDYIANAKFNGEPFGLLPSCIYERVGYELAMNDSLSIIETAYPTLNAAAKAVINDILIRILTQ